MRSSVLEIGQISTPFQGARAAARECMLHPRIRSSSGTRLVEQLSLGSKKTAPLEGAVGRSALWEVVLPDRAARTFTKLLTVRSADVTGTILRESKRKFGGKKKIPLSPLAIVHTTGGWIMVILPWADGFNPRPVSVPLCFMLPSHNVFVPGTLHHRELPREHSRRRPLFGTATHTVPKVSCLHVKPDNMKKYKCTLNLKAFKI